MVLYHFVCKCTNPCAHYTCTYMISVCNPWGSVAEKQHWFRPFIAQCLACSCIWLSKLTLMLPPPSSLPPSLHSSLPSVPSSSLPPPSFPSLSLDGGPNHSRLHCVVPDAQCGGEHTRSLGSPLLLCTLLVIWGISKSYFHLWVLSVVEWDLLDICKLIMLTCWICWYVGTMRAWALHICMYELACTVHLCSYHVLCCFVCMCVCVRVCVRVCMRATLSPHIHSLQFLQNLWL